MKVAEYSLRWFTFRRLKLSRLGISLHQSQANDNQDKNPIATKGAMVRFNKTSGAEMENASEIEWQ